MTKGCTDSNPRTLGREGNCTKGCIDSNPRTLGREGNDQRLQCPQETDYPPSCKPEGIWSTDCMCGYLCMCTSPLKDFLNAANKKNVKLYRTIKVLPELCPFHSILINLGLNSRSPQYKTDEIELKKNFFMKFLFDQAKTLQAC